MAAITIFTCGSGKSAVNSSLASHRRQQEMLAKEEEFIARFAARASHAAQVQSRVKKLEKIDRIEIPPPSRRPSASSSPNRRAAATTWSSMRDRPRPGRFRKGANIVGLRRRFRAYPAREKIAVVGVNGAGKSTFLKVLAGQAEPECRHVTIGANVHGATSASTPWISSTRKRASLKPSGGAPPWPPSAWCATSAPPSCFRATTWTNASTSSPAGRKAGWCSPPCWPSRSTF
jgi:ATPase subunit of ABC transporter with duplicated ATPase domains